MAFEKFTQKFGPNSTQTQFGTFPCSPTSSSSHPFSTNSPPHPSPPRHTSPRWGNQPKSSFGELNYQINQGPSPVTQYDASLHAATNSPARPSNFQGPKRARSPTSVSKVHLDSYTRDVSERGLGVPQRMRSPIQASEDDDNVEGPRHPFEEARRWPIDPTNSQAPKRTRSPSVQFANEFSWRTSHPSQGDNVRDIASSPRYGNTPTIPIHNSDATIHQRFPPFSPYNDNEGAGSTTVSSHVPKRNRSPSFTSAEEHLPGTSYSTQDDTERETQAKAKRLARFGVELSQPVQRNLDHTKHKFHDQALVEKRTLVPGQFTEAAGDFMQSDYEGPESSTVIIGLCPDMCPESERDERERKGDLDRYERLDGDRNQTSISLAVKKYNRTAEREADLIRPMPVLQQTINYLLALLDQPYDDKFLSMYNFLWDRMRAIRMDLRMQHIFDQDAIAMLEQMIRLHIIAMHELCEYTKGEGFSEGFDAHLNIEQMNKTSVELFQMYDDHRKRGKTVVSEKEFRGYYALLKLDKHPGYKVEPAELSLDLANMTPEIRQTPEILFARDVARACRTCNFIAFFRLARRATYLQACLMHAHFAKLRTQALVSLHSGLQNNQGIPVAHVTKWLGMEGEDIEALLEYHGFSIKEFEDMYMVKEGLFLNSDNDYPTKCSRLVHMKKSRTVVKDISFSKQLMWPTEEPKRIVSDKKAKLDSKAIQFVKSRPSVDLVDENMLTFEEDPTVIDGFQVQPILQIPSTSQKVKIDSQVAEVWHVSSPLQSPQSGAGKVVKPGKPARETLRNDSLERNLHVQDVPHISVTERAHQSERLERAPQSERSEGSSEFWIENSGPNIVLRPQENDETLTADEELEDEQDTIQDNELGNEEDAMMVHQDNEVAMVKHKLILRKWKRFSSRRKELREHQRLAADAALSSLTLGPPIQQVEAPSSRVCVLDIDRALRERRRKLWKSWSRMNTSEAVGEILGGRNPNAECVCWKLVVFSGINITEGDNTFERSQNDHLASLWLHSKLMGVQEEIDDELVVSSLDLSIWRKWATHQYHHSSICCLSVIRELKFSMLEGLEGAGAVLFLVSESVPLDIQKAQLHRLLMVLPPGSCIPLLIFCSTKTETSTIIYSLGLHDVDKTRVSSFSVGSLVDDQTPEHVDGFFSSERLVEGIQWLASQSPVMPILHYVKTHDLVKDHLSSPLAVLENMNFSAVGPNDCISIFNEALDKSTTCVRCAAETNPSGWPCHEITLLESSNEHSIAKSLLPSVGWSSSARIDPILRRIQGCKLAYFSDELSLLNNGSDKLEDIKNHKSELENCLIRYLTNSSKMDKTLATSEARVIVQAGATLEPQEDSKYCIKPRWVAIFRRIFNWRLMDLSGGLDSMAYVLEDQNDIVTPGLGREELSGGASSALHGSDNLGLEVYGSLPYSLTQPSLDEMIEACYNTLQFGRQQSEPEATPSIPRTLNHGKEIMHAATASDDREDEQNCQQDVESTKTGDGYTSGNLSKRATSDDYHYRELVLATKSRKGVDKLSRLLEQCIRVQNKIGERLSIYF